MPGSPWERLWPGQSEMTVRDQVHALQEAGDAELSALYAEFANEDRRLAEAGMGDYADQLAAEDCDEPCGPSVD